ncbi:MAG: repeat-containing protein [Planctomycetaceae bacterium]|nr:repeat-containing protein [Planctomycetaceae bacterium]
MSTAFQPHEAPRDVHEIISAILCESDEDLRWALIVILHHRGSLDVLQAAESLCQSQCLQERSLGAHLLGQLGSPERTYPKQCLEILLGLLNREREATVLRSVITALSHLGEPRAISRFASHFNPDVRFSVAFALGGETDARSIQLLIQLSEDSDSDVRDWATFGLGTLLALDTPEIRDALFVRLYDEDDDTRSEALVGLAHRKDLRIIPALKQELSSGCVGTLAVEAAQLIASLQLVPELLALQSWWDVDPELLERAIQVSTST